MTLFAPLEYVGDCRPVGYLTGDRLLGDLIGDGVRFRDPGVFSSYRPYRLKWKHIEWIHEQFEMHKDCLLIYIRSGFYEFYLCRTPSMSKKGDYLLILIFFRRVGKKKNFKIEKPGRLRSWTGRSTVSIHRSNSIRHGQAFRSPFNRKFFIKRKIITIIKARKLVERRTVSGLDRSFSKRWCT